MNETTSLSSQINIYKRMLAITSELETVAKNLDVNTGGKNGYKAVSERDVIDAVKPLEMKHGVYSYPVSREIVDSQLLQEVKEWQGKESKKTIYYSKIKTVYRFCNVDAPLDYIETVTYSEGIDSQDKGFGKAMTYADKYALMKAYKISTGEDLDAQPSIEKEYKKDCIDFKKIKVLTDTMKRKGVAKEQVVSRYGVKELSELTTANFMDAMKGLELMKDIDLGL